MKLACIRAGFQLQHRAAGLSPAAGLFLEDHLAHCESCREQANLLSELRSLYAANTPELSAAARTRAIQAAMAQAAPGRAHARPALRPRSTYLWLPAIAAAAVFVGVRMYPNAPQTAPQTHANANAEVNGDRVLAGSLAAAASAIADGQELRTQTGAVLALAHAKVELRPASSARWHARSHELQLDSGSVMVDVDPTLHAPFEVHTARFHVLVLGTRFEVSPTTVRVVHGRVAIRNANDEPVVVLDGAAQSTWQWTDTQQASEPVRVETPAADDARTEPTRALKPRAHASVDALLEEARQQLVEHHVADARRTLERVQALAPSGTQRAEALSLKAECALVAGDFMAARTGYLKVAEQFASASAGETALFAAARIAAEHGSNRDSVQLFERYLSRYPNGRFVKEAKLRLRVLEPSRAGASQSPPLAP